MSSPIATLPIDYSGSALPNKIEGEIHAVGLNKLIVPMFGAFHKKNLVLTDLVSGDELTEDQYMVTDLYQDATLIAGDTEIYTAIVITDNLLAGNIAVDYQALGGPYSRHSQRLIDWLISRQLNVGTLDWHTVYDIPKKFQPSHHLHLLAHVYGMEYIVDALTRLEEGIRIGSGPVYYAFLANIDAKLALIKTRAHLAVDEMVLARFESFKSGLNAEGIGLGLLVNMGILTRDIAAQIADPGFNSRAITSEQYVAISSLDAFYEAFYEKVVSRATTNLDLSTVPEQEPNRPNLLTMVNGTIFALPSKKRAVQDGMIIDMHVYPEGVSENDEYVITKINGNLTNAGGIYLSINKTTLDTYIGSLENDGCNNKFLWCKMHFEGELSELNKLIQDHIDDTKNPHEVDKYDLELGKVENLPVITEEEIINDKSARKYITLDTVMYYARKFLTNAKPPQLPGETLDPNAKTMDQCQIIFNHCKKQEPIPEKWPTKGQTITTWCDQTDKMIRYTDGAGGFYDEVFELNASDCGYIEHPKRGSLVSEHCSGETGFDKTGVYANGDGTTYESLIKKNDPDCGYIAPPDKLKEGAIMAVYCSGMPGEQKTRYADGNGGYTELTTGINVSQCGGSGSSGPNPNPTGGPGPTPTGIPPAGSVITTTCNGTTKVVTYADGNGGSYVIETPDSPDCANQPTPDPIGGNERFTGSAFMAWVNNPTSETGSLGEERPMYVGGYNFIPGKEYYFRVEVREDSSAQWIPIREKYHVATAETLYYEWGTVPFVVQGRVWFQMIVSVKGSEGYQYFSGQRKMDIS